MAKSLNLDAACVDRILTRLSALSALPQEGVLAGQALASAVMEELGAGPGVYNDIDVFVAADAARKAMLASSEHLNSEALRLGIPAAELDEYRMLGLCDDRNLHILGATQSGLINHVWCDDADDALNPARIVQSFDLNAVEIALDLKTRHIVWSPEFEFFVATRELQLTSLNTPARSMLRYFKKKHELQAWGDDRLVVDLAASWLAHTHEENPSATLSLKFRALANEHQNAFSDVFAFDEVTGVLSVRDDWQYPEGMEELLAHSSKDYVLGLNALARMLCKMSYSQKLARSAKLEAELTQTRKKFAGNEGAAAGSVIGLSLSLLGCDYLGAQRSSTHFELVERTLVAHPGLAVPLFGLTLEEQYRCVLDLRKRAKTEGTHIYGWVEASATSLDLRTQLMRDAFFQRMAKKDATDVVVSALFETQTCDEGVVRELTTVAQLRKEGSELSHCVGGYGPVLRKHNAHILSIRTGTDRRSWSTAEIRIEPEGSGRARKEQGSPQHIRVVQHYGPGNCTPTAENVALLNGYLRQAADSLRLSFEPTTRQLSFMDLLAA